jgi:C1A family cysteine protease
MERFFGWLPDAPDGRDFLYSNIRKTATVKLPDELDYRKLMPVVEDQGIYSSCVANALTTALEFLQKKKVENDRSRMFVYYNARLIDHLERQDDGCVIRSAIKSVVDSGVCSEYVWPYINKNLMQTPSENSYKRAKRSLLSDYYRIELGDIDDIKAALVEGYPVVFGIILYKSFLNPNKGIIPMPSTVNDYYIGRHAMVICGFTDTHFIVQNSWGRKWGDKGYCYMSFEYISKYTELGGSDYWVVRKMEKRNA